MRIWIRRGLWAGITVIGMFGMLLIWAEVAIGRCASAGFSAAAVPARPVAMVLGTSRLLANDRLNPYFTARVDAAAELYRLGKTKHFIVSGDNGNSAYDEASDLRMALMAAGVPDAAITRDYAGFRTLDSVVRAKAVFGQQSFIIVSQAFHNQRAIYLARAHGLDVVGCNAADPAISGTRVWLRERLARMRCVLDVNVFGTEPHFYGPPIRITTATAQR